VPSFRHAFRPAMALSCLVLVPAFGFARLEFPYLDRPARYLVHRLDGILPGGRGIYTSDFTYAMLVDIRQAAQDASSEGKSFVILPDYPGYWVLPSPSNPLRDPWPSPSGVSTYSERRAMLDSILRRRGNMRVILMKYDPLWYQYWFDFRAVPFRFDSKDGWRTDWLNTMMSCLTKIKETDYIYVYE
jgi:hypothetical protein